MADFVASCSKCQKSKADRHSRKTKLMPMPTGSKPWEEIAMDFVGELPDSEGYNAILVITDRFSKIQHYIPAKTTWTAVDVANAFIWHIWRLYGLPKHITSDRGPQFISAFWREIHRKLDIRLRLSTAYHPQTDGLSERAIQTLKQYLRIFCHDQQHMWSTYLPSAEFAYNTAPTTHGYSPFQSLYGWQPKTLQIVDDSDYASPAAEEWLNRMTTVHSQILETLRKINDKRSDLTLEKARSFKIGDWVLIDRRNLTVKAGNNRSLMHKWIGPYQVIKHAGNHAYKLQLPKGMRIHHVVHTTLLKPYNGNVQDEIDDEQEDLFYNVDYIVASKRFGRKIKYRVRWEGYEQQDDTWEPIENLRNSTDAVKEFHQTHPQALRDPTVVL